MLDPLAAIGAESIHILWMPLVAWTVLWALAEGALWVLRNAHPGVRYRLTQAVLWALPLSLALAAWVPTDWLSSSWALSPWIPMHRSAAAGTAALTQPLIDAVELASPISPTGPNLVLVGLGLGVCAVVVLALVSLARLGMQSVAVLKLRRAIPRMSDPAFGATAQRIASSLGVEGATKIVLTTADLVPMTLGIRRPLVVIPATLPAADRRAALLHELVHVRTHDPLAQVTEATITALFSAHPAVHRLSRQCDLLREMACDAAVLDHHGVSRRSYAALVSSFATPTHVQALPATVGMASPAFHVHHRLRAMSMSRPLPSRMATWSPALAVLVVAALFVTAGTAFAQTAELLEVVEEPIETIHEVVVDSVKVRTRLGGIVVEREPTPLERQQLEEAAAQLRTIQGDLNVLVEEIPMGQLQRYTTEADASVHALRGELDALSLLQEQAGTILAGSDSVIAVSQLRLIREQDRLRDVQAELEVALGMLEAAQGTIVETQRASEVARIEETPLEAIEEARLALGTVYPNPAQDEVRIAVSVSEASDVTIGLYDLTGRRMATRELRLEAGAHTVTLDTRELAAGTYVSRVAAKGESGTARSTNRFTIVR